MIGGNITLVSSRIFVLPALEKLEELLRPPLFEETHKRAFDRLHLRTGHLGDPAIAVNEAACDLLELEVAGDVGVDEDAGELSRRDDKLGDEIDGVVAVAAEVLRDGLIGSELAVELHANQGLGSGPRRLKRGSADLGKVQTGTVTTIVVVPVHVEDLLALDGQETGEDTFGQTGTEHDDLSPNSLVGRIEIEERGPYVVFFIHGNGLW